MQKDVIVNRVAKSGIITLNLEDFYPKGELLTFDLKDYLFKGLILREKDFRAAMKEHHWTAYENKNVAICCTADAIVPVWAYMLVARYLKPHANHFVYGNTTDLLTDLMLNALRQLNVEPFADVRVVIKGCGDKKIPQAAYVEASRLLLPVVKSLMYGEPCSTVPIYKKR